MSNYYDILKVKTNASQTEIKSAYKKLALVYHPDRNNGLKESEEKFKVLYEAYKTLSNVTRRRIYDNQHHIYKAPVVKYSYKQAGFYSSINNNVPSQPLNLQKADAFVSKKKDVDYYLFWFTLCLIILLGIFLVMYSYFKK